MINQIKAIEWNFMEKKQMVLPFCKRCYFGILATTVVYIRKVLFKRYLTLCARIIV